jgi:type II secretory pathway pseudopilin PulG
MRRTSGFTVIELLTALVIIIVLTSLAFAQKNDLDASRRDQQRKSNANAIYYALTNAYYLKNKYYPIKIDTETLPYIDPAVFKPVGDPGGYTVRYRGFNCSDTQCKNFEVKVELEKEAAYKKSR